MYSLLIVSVNGDPLADLGTMHAGGQCKYILEVGKGLVRHGWAIDVFTIKEPGRIEREYITEGFEVLRFALPSGEPYNGHLSEVEITYLSDAMWGDICARGQSYDVVLACYWLSGLVALELRNKMRKRMLLSLCSVGYFKYQAYPTPDLEARVAIEKEVSRQADHVLATSPEEWRVLTSIYGIDGNKISLIPRGVNVNVFRPTY